MTNNKTAGTNEHIWTEIGSIEEVNFLLMTELSVWFVLTGYLEITRNGSNILIRPGNIFILNKGDIVRVIDSGNNQTLTIKVLPNKYSERMTFKLAVRFSPFICMS